MSRVLELFLAYAAAVSGAVVVDERAGTVNAVRKVVEMLNTMVAKAKQDKQSEEVMFAKFSTWCSDHQSELKVEIDKNSLQIQSLAAESGKLKADATALDEEVKQLQVDLSKFEADKAAQKAQREKDHENFLAQQQDYAESVDALDRAIMTLQKQNYDRAAFVQVMGAGAGGLGLPAKVTQMIAAFFEADGDDDGFLSRSSPQANAYEFQSTSIIDILKKLRDEFRDKKATCEKEEMNSKHAYEMIAQDLTGASDRTQEAIDTKGALRNEKVQASALLDKQHSLETSAKAENEQMLGVTAAECSEKQASFSEKQTLRSEELTALQKAIEILSSKEVQSNGQKYLSMVGATSTALMQEVRGKGGDSSKSDSVGIRHRVSEYLFQRSKALNSKQLEMLAQKLAADPFVQVRKMIQDMITRLLAEANSDATHEGFCDREMGQSKLTRDRLTEEIDGLTAAIENGKATITLLAQHIATLQKEVADIAAAVSESSELRSAEKAQNAATVKDCEDAQQALSQALAVLKEFYAKAGKATALLQQPVIMGSDEWDSLANPAFKGKIDKGHKQGMQTFGDVFNGQQEEAGGVLAMLEVIASDFATLKVDTNAAENMAEKSHKEFLAESTKNTAAKNREIEMSHSDKVSAENKLQTDTADFKLTEDKLLAAERYHATLVPQCVDQGMTVEQRNKARQDEIDSLKEALRILNGESV